MVDDDVLHSLIGVYGELGRQITAEASTAGRCARSPAWRLGRCRARTPRASPVTGPASESLGSTEEGASRADAIQYQLGSGPCVDAVEKGHVFCSPDLGADARGPPSGL
jgi:hypothetical protein